MNNNRAPKGAWAEAPSEGRPRSFSGWLLVLVLVVGGSASCDDDASGPGDGVADTGGDSGSGDTSGQDTTGGDMSDSDAGGDSGPAAGTLGGTCDSDEDCPNGAWCSDVSGYERCAPRALNGAGLPMTFVYIPAGTFTQSSGEQSFESTLSRPYFLSRYEVTDGQWSELVDDLPTAHDAGCGTSCPVEAITYWEAYEYANRLTIAELGEDAVCYELTGCTGDPGASGFSCTGATFDADCTGYRLPTESEWEHAVRAGTESAYYWGDGAELTDIDDYAWYEDNSGERAHPVGEKAPNDFGLYDMAGNATEWCWDAWTEDYPTEPQTDYIYRGSSSFFSFRGGNYSDEAVRLQSGIRGGVPSGRFLGLGLRLARTVPGT